MYGTQRPDVMLRVRVAKLQELPGQIDASSKYHEIQQYILLFTFIIISRTLLELRRYVTLVRFKARVLGAEQLAYYKKWQRLTGPLWGDSAPAMRNAGVLSKSLA